MAQKQTPEDAFYENLTLGLMKTLSNVPRITNVTCEKRQPCEKVQIINWEQRHNVYLPEDMKKFYLSTDGFILHWSYQYAPDDIRRVGLIHFPHLLQITLLRENIEAFFNTTDSQNTNSSHIATATTSNVTTSSSSSSTTTINTSSTSSSGGSNSALQNNGPTLTTKSKIFELNNICDMAKVCLVYEMTSHSNPKIYLLELNTFKWQFLSDTFSEYLRMAIAHLGLPYWELCFSSFGLPSWTEQLFLLLAPYLLEETDQRRGHVIQPISEQPYNQLDPSIFRTKPKCNKINPKIK